MPADPRLIQFQQSAEKVHAHLLAEFSKLQTGRASAALVDSVSIEAYGQRQPLKAIAGVSIQDNKTIVVQAWDRSVMGNIERALQAANLGASIQNDGTVIRVILPPMTQERREQMVKSVSRLAEEARIGLRQQRQAVHDLIKQEKDEDVKETLTKGLQKCVDDMNAKVDAAKKAKEEEVLKV